MMRLPSKFRFSLLLLGMVALLFASGCNRNGPVQHHYSTSVGCLVANDFYAAYFSAYVEPTEEVDDDTAELFKSYCHNIPKTGTVFFTADLVDDDLRTQPIGIQLVEREYIENEEDETDSFKDIRVIKKIPARYYPQGTIEAQENLYHEGHYAIYLNIGGDEVLIDEDRLTIPLYIGTDFGATSFWKAVRYTAEFMMTYIFPIMILLLILAPFLPVKKWIQSGQHSSGRRLSE